MTRWRQLSAGLLTVTGLCGAVAGAAQEYRRPFPVVAGQKFQSAETQQLEQDDGANPGMLWVDQGAGLWRKVTGTAGKSCESCHADARTSMAGVAARYPLVDQTSGQLMNVELRINNCRTRHQGAPALAWESDDLLALTAFVTRQSRGIARNVRIDGPAQSYFERGRSFFLTREGQLNLACVQCHDENWGKRLRGDRISQGNTDGWPAYRLEWQTLGSLHRRLRACSLGVRAEVLDYGAPDYLALELFLAWRGNGLPIASPGVRR